MNIDLLKSSSVKKVYKKNLLEEAIVPELNIYNQAYLEIDRPLLQAKTVHAQTKHELGVMFDIKGELKGKIYCFLDTYNKVIKEKEDNFFKLLFVESMNILLGQTLTNVEETNDITAIISAPNFTTEVKIEENKSSRSSDIYSVGYKLIAEFNEYNCRIIFDIEKPI